MSAKTKTAPSAASSIAGAGPLADFRVLELGSFIAAPTAGRLLADFGADVIKVERPDGGDEVRQWRLYGAETSMLWRTLSRNKRSITVDLRSDEGRELILGLVAGCDAVIENFRPGTLERWGLGPEELSAVNPELVLVRISGYGQDGPYHERPGFGAIAEALGGLRHLTGDPDRPPVRVGVSIGDTLAGMNAAMGVVMALLARERARAAGAQAQFEVVDVALYEAVFGVTESMVAEWSGLGYKRERTGSLLPGIAPTSAYPSADGKWVLIAGNSDAIFSRLMRAIGREDLADDSQLQTNRGRWDRHEELDAAIAAWTEGRTQDQILEVMQSVSVPAGPIYDAEDIVADPHFRARGAIELHEVPGIDGPVAFPGVAPKLKARPGGTRWLGPELGAHNDEVLGDLLGLDEERRAALRAGGVI